MPTAYSSKGQVVRINAESALGTDSTEYGEIRYNSCEMSTAQKHGSDNPNTGHNNWADLSDRPVRFLNHIPDAVSMECYLRSGATKTDKPPVIELLESAGMVYVTNVPDVVGTPGTGSYILTTGGATEAAIGMVVGVEVPVRGWYPSLVGSNAAKTVTPMMDLPEQSPGSGTVCRMHTVYPYSRAVPATETLMITKFSMGIHTTAPDLATVARGCSVMKFDPLVIEPSKPVTFKCSLGATSFAYAASTLPAPVFIDSEKYPITGGYFECGYAATTVGAAPGITFAAVPIIKAEVDLGIQVTPIPGNGDTTCVSGIQGYWSQVVNPTIKITRIHSAQTLQNQWNETVPDVPYYIHFVQPSSLQTVPMWGFFAPACYIASEPEIDWKSAEYIQSTTTYQMTSPRINNATEAPNTAATVPWYFSVGLPYEA